MKLTHEEHMLCAGIALMENNIVYKIDHTLTQERNIGDVIQLCCNNYIIQSAEYNKNIIPFSQNPNHRGDYGDKSYWRYRCIKKLDDPKDKEK